MKRTGFTMIELIFVIVILGILASVALPKLIGVKDQADEGLVKGFVGTLNRTVGPAKWSASIADAKSGSIKVGSEYNITTTDTDFPASFAAGTIVNTAKCVTSTSTTVATNAATNKAAVTTDLQYVIVCRDGNASTAPRFWYTDKNNTASITLDDTKLKL